MIKRLILLLLFAILLLPLYWMGIGSIQDIASIMKMPPRIFPRKITFANYQQICSQNPILFWTANSTMISTGYVVLNLLVCSMSGYSFAMFDFKGKKLIFWIFIASIMIPFQATIISKFVILRYLSLINTHWAIILTGAFNPINIFLFKCYADSIPKAIPDCARVDGAGELRILRSIIGPLCKPILGALAIMNYIRVLNDYLWQALVLQDIEKYPLLVGIIWYIRNNRNIMVGKNPIGISLAGGTMLFIPLLIIFCIFQKYFISGIKTGALKE